LIGVPYLQPHHKQDDKEDKLIILIDEGKTIPIYEDPTIRTPPLPRSKALYELIKKLRKQMRDKTKYLEPYKTTPDQVTNIGDYILPQNLQYDLDKIFNTSLALANLCR
jgi:hypothetical protein